MPKRTYILFLIDVLVALDKISRYLKNCETPEALLADEMRFDAVLKQFEIIGEAMRYLVDDSELAHVQDKSWRGAIALRNILVHEYFGIDVHEVFFIGIKKVPELKKSLINVCKGLQAESLVLSIKKTKNDLIQGRQLESAQYLQSLENLFQEK
jgi:uncharacterized protein with HEPN domain